ncbi:CCA tRNA nucleotidyltransferase [Terriglobus roseus]|uniref:Poly A polymerase head domain-containing protein n=1 Tax=Terriglobus roseus TaxID=392734 RepID=A0A1G7J2W2_9BACT|nr:CCA tRNA nucleotidyltransferase [Terriglobus roseus]SDF19134.1 Poly A polymerase head domain-containing protein [Terriglobus roseus]
MADYIYLLENRLSHAQQKAVGALRTIARESDATIFLTGGAVRDLTAGASVRDLDLTIQGDLSKIRKGLGAAGFEIVGENAPAHQLFLTYSGGVRLELSSAVAVSWPKPGKPKYEPGSLIDDLRGRDFTANAMAISLNEGSYGLLMDPLNGVADIENRELRLVSNYGFIEEPSRLIRAARLMSRLGWQLEEKTRQRYETAKEEGYISALSAWNKGYELEEIFHEEDPVRVLRALETEGWMQHLFPALQSAKVNTTSLSDLYTRQGELQIQGVLGHIAAIAFPLVTGKMSSGDVASLKKLVARQGFVREIEALDARVKDFAAKLSAKEAATPSAAWKLLHATEPDLVLATYFSSKSAPVQARLKTFLTESPNARQRIPYQLLTEMRITPDLPGYNELLDKLFFELMDGRLATPEEMKAFLEPYSPPAPPPPPNLRRARARKEPKGRGKKKAAELDIDGSDFEGMPLTVAAEEELAGLETGLTEEGDLTGPDRGPEPTEEEPIEKVAPLPTKAAKDKKAAKVVAEKKSPAAAPAKTAPAAKPVVAAKPAAPAKKAVPPAKAPAPVKAAIPAKKVAAKPVAPAKKAPAKVVAKTVAAKPVKKVAAKPVKKAAPVKKAPAKPVKKVVAAKPVKAVAKKVVAVKKAPAKVVKKAVPVKAVKKAAPAKKVVAKPAKKAPAKKSRR